MISYIILDNFKSYNHVKLDLQKKKNTPKSFSLIYGENGSGKSNLISSVLFLLNTFETLPDQERTKKLLDNLETATANIDDNDFKQKLINKILKQSTYTLQDLISESKTLGCSELMKLEFGFTIDGSSGIYTMHFNDNEIVEESLKCEINHRTGFYFNIKDNCRIITLSPTIFFSTNYRLELIEQIKKYWGKNTFLSIMFNEIKTKNNDYIDENVSDKFLKILSQMRRISVLCKNGQGSRGSVGVPYPIMNDLENGEILKQDIWQLSKCETALNTFFTQLYSDIKNVYYSVKSSNDGYEYNLFFKKLIGNSLVNVPIQKESTGTRKFLVIFPFILNSSIGNSVFIDEADSGIHDKLMQQILELLKESMQGQFIATTHNTLLMETTENDSLYIIHSDAKGQKDISCISDYSSRTQKNNNARSKYLKGDYDGIPITGYLDFEELTDELLNDENVDNEMLLSSLYSKQEE